MKIPRFLPFLLVMLILPSLSFAQETSVETDSVASITELQEILVKGDSDYIKEDGSVTTIRIKGSAYQNIGRLPKMLPNLPGLISKNGIIEVTGIGKPLFIVDGREIKDDTELNMIQSKDIKDIKIERNPGLAYSSNWPAVVYITTIKKINDFFHLDVSNDLIKFRKWQESPSLNASVKINKFSSTLTYQYYFSEALIKETYFREIEENDSPEFSLLEPRSYTTRQKNAHSLTWSGEYDINPSNRIGVYYYLNHNPKNNTESGYNEITTNRELEKISFTENTRGINNLNSFTALYTFKKGSHNLSIIQDVALRRVTSDKLTLQNEEGENDIISNSRRAYDIYTSNIRYSTNLPRNFGLGIGAKYTFTDSKTDIHSAGQTMYEIPAVNSLFVRENSPEGYLYLTKWLQNVYISPGVRIEHTDREITNHQTAAEPVKIRERATVVSPQLTVYYRNNYGLSLNASYKRMRVQPTFSQLNSGIVYMDPYSFSEGNPNLKNQIGDMFSVSGAYRKFQFYLYYNHYRNYITTVQMQSTPGSYIAKEMDINLPSFNVWYLSLSYSLNINKFNAYTQLRFKMPSGLLKSDGSLSHQRFISTGLSLNLSYSLTDWLSLYTNYNHQGHSEGLVTIQRSVDAWNLGVSGEFFEGRLSVDLSFCDILNRENYNNITYRFKNMNWGTRGSGDSRGLWLSLSYSIFDKQIKRNIKPGNTSDIMRTN